MQDVVSPSGDRTRLQHVLGGLALLSPCSGIATGSFAAAPKKRTDKAPDRILARDGLVPVYSAAVCWPRMRGRDRRAKNRVSKPRWRDVVRGGEGERTGQRAQLPPRSLPWQTTARAGCDAPVSPRGSYLHRPVERRRVVRGQRAS